MFCNTFLFPQFIQNSDEKIPSATVQTLKLDRGIPINQGITRFQILGEDDIIGLGRSLKAAQGVRSRSDKSLFCSRNGKALLIPFFFLCRIGAAFARFRGDSRLGSGFNCFLSDVVTINSAEGLGGEVVLLS